MSLDLCKGIAIVIDDKIFPIHGEPEDQIVKIVKKISEQGVPYCAYSKLSEARKVIKNLSSVNFLILDWDFHGDLDLAAAENIIKPNHSATVISFIKDFLKVCFCPIFIFSNAHVSDIKDMLIKNDLYEEGKKNFIYIQAKKDLVKGNTLFRTIDKWVNENPTIYTLKNWENSFSQSKNKVFKRLFEKSPVWPKVLWKSYDEDNVDPQSNLNDVIFRLIKSSTSITLESAKIKRRGKIDIEEIKDVIQGTMYVFNANLPKNEYAPGDIFKKNGNYFINIRPECDTILNRGGCDGNLYVLKGCKLTNAQFRRKHYNKKYGLIKDNNSLLLYGLDGKDFVRFNLKELQIIHNGELSANRLCRLISPYVNDVQQQFSSYVGRFGLPRIPNAVLASIK